MGWTFTHKTKDQSVKQFFEKEFNGEHGKVLDCAVKNRAAYIAFERANGSGRRKVFALVCLLSYRPRDHFNFGYKDMDETMGPFECDCPERILDLLTDTDDETAGRWRKRCRENLDKGKVVSALTPGTVIEFDAGLTFSNGRRVKRLKVVSKRPLVFADAENPAFQCRIRQATLRAGGWTTI